MVILEINDDKYGKVMKAVQAIEHYLHCVKDTLTEEAVSTRSHKKDDYEDDDFTDYDKEQYRGRKMSNRYM